MNTLFNLTKKTLIAQNLLVADRFWPRFKGLLGRKELTADTALVIEPCNSVHTWFMRFPIDLLFLSGDFFVLHVAENVRPWRLVPYVRGARRVVELQAGAAARTGTSAGDQLSIVDP